MPTFIHIRSRSIGAVLRSRSNPISNLMTPLDRILNEGDAGMLTRPQPHEAEATTHEAEATTLEAEVKIHLEILIII